jgi:hypothetical protein
MLTLSHTSRRSTLRTVRGIAALCALVMVASNALAAMGLCIAKAPVALQTSKTAALEQAPCPQHVADQGGAVPTGEPAAAKHCPQDDPGAQVRGDVPATAYMPAIFHSLRITISNSAGTLRNRAAADESAPTPLYARLSRLLL